MRDMHSRDSALNGMRRIAAPNMAFERDAPKAARPSTLRWASDVAPCALK